MRIHIGGPIGAFFRGDSEQESSVGRHHRLHAIAAGAILSAALVTYTPAASAAVVFSPGPYVLPEGIAAAPGGGYLIADANNNIVGTIYQIPATGGPPSASEPVGFSVYQEVPLSGFYGSKAGTFLAIGSTASGGQVFDTAYGA